MACFKSTGGEDDYVAPAKYGNFECAHSAFARAERQHFSETLYPQSQTLTISKFQSDGHHTAVHVAIGP